MDKNAGTEIFKMLRNTNPEHFFLMSPHNVTQHPAGCFYNDLFAWTPDTNADDYPENPLQKIRQQSLPDLQRVIGGLSLEEVKKD